MRQIDGLDRRQAIIAITRAGLLLCARPTAAFAKQPPPVVSVADSGARSHSGRDETRAIQSAIHAVESSGGGTVLISGQHRCGNLIISGDNVCVQGEAAWLIDGRLTIMPEATNIEVADLGILDTRGDSRTFLMDVSGRNCRFANVQLVKDPVAGGYQLYLRQSADGCRFSRLRTRGSNGIMIAGKNHWFEDFQLDCKDLKGDGDDAFAIKGIEDSTENITIRNGVVRGFAAVVSFGSEIGTRGSGGPPGAVRNVNVENVAGDRCGSIAFFKPGALIYDYRHGVVEEISLANLTLRDAAGVHFRSGIRMLAARGAVIRHVRAHGIEIVARARDRGIAPTAAIDITLLDDGAPATIEHVDLQVVFTDPYAGAPHCKAAPGYPVDFIVEVEKQNPAKGIISNIALDVEGRGASFGGVYIGAGLDGAIALRRARLTRVVSDPPTTAGAAGIWSESKLLVGDVEIQAVNGPRFSGRAFQNRR